MNVFPAWKRGYTGKNVVVTILDDGIQVNHPDLAQNVDPKACTDINGNDNDPTPKDDGLNKHGTRCAGEVAAVAFNEYCGVGIAYNASIGGTYKSPCILCLLFLFSLSLGFLVISIISLLCSLWSLCFQQHL